MYTYALPVGGSVTFTGPTGAWLRIDVMATAGARVELRFAWEQGYRPRATPLRVRLGRFRVRALKLVGEDRVELGIDVQKGWRESKECEKDARPHSTSEFWLEVAATRGSTGVPVAGDGAGQAEAARQVQESPGKVEQGGPTLEAGERMETRPQSVVEPAFASEEEEHIEPEQDEAELAETDLGLPTLDVAEAFGDLDTSVLDLDPGAEVLEDEDSFDDEEEEEEDEWAARGRKKPRPGRQLRQPKLKKPRNNRRGY